MRRRELISLLSGAAVAWPLAARAQDKLHRIGFLAGGTRPIELAATSYGAFSRGMRELGFVEGKRFFIIEWRFAEGRYALFPELAAELVRLNVDVIVVGTPAAVRPVQHATVCDSHCHGNFN